MRNAKLIQSSTVGLPKDSFIYSVLHNPNYPFISSISSDDSLTCCDPESLNVISKISIAHEGITCLDNLSRPGCLVTAGRDGVVRLWDTRAFSLQGIGEMGQDGNRGCGEHDGDILHQAPKFGVD